MNWQISRIEDRIIETKEDLSRKLAQMVHQGLVSWVIQTAGEEWPCSTECWLCRDLSRGYELKEGYSLECPRPLSMKELPPCHDGEAWKQRKLEPPTIKIELPVKGEIVEAG